MDMTKIVQDAKVGQQAGKNGAVVVQIQNVGDVAINKAAAKDGDVFAAMEYILSRLPEPKMVYLRALALVTSYRMHNQVEGAARYLGVTHCIYHVGRRSNRTREITAPVLRDGKEFPLLPESPG
jgi:hypothetical protein